MKKLTQRELHEICWVLIGHLDQEESRPRRSNTAQLAFERGYRKLYAELKRLEQQKQQ